MSNFFTFKKNLKGGDEFYIIVKELPPIILSGEKDKEYHLKKEDLIWRPQKRVVNYIEFTSGDVYDEDEMLLEDTLVKFDNLADAQKYCDEKNKNE